MKYLIIFSFSIILFGCSYGNNLDKLEEASYTYGCINGIIHDTEKYNNLSSNQISELLDYCSKSKTDILKADH